MGKVKLPPGPLVLDTNILIDFLSGDERAAAILEGDCIISRIVWMELLVGVHGTRDEKPVRAFLNTFRLEEITADIAEEAIALRAARKLRLPDAILLATARLSGYPLVTRNTKDFKAAWPEVMIPYRVR